MTYTEDRSFFDTQNQARKVSLLPAQYDPAVPSVDGLDRATNLLIPDYLTSHRLANFPSDLYDLRQHSHLSRFMRALMGDSGAGGSRKRFLIARFQQAFSSTHFYDLDRFYGALFGTPRFQSERIKINPYTDVATSDEWDQVHTADAHFRERVFALAKAIPMGGTKPGLKTAAEAIVGAPCEVIEDWARVDYLHGHGFNTPDDTERYTWRQVEFLGRYRDIEDTGFRWRNLGGNTMPLIEGQRHYKHFFPDGLYSYSLAKNLGGPTWARLERRIEKLPVAKNDRGGVLVRPLKTYPDTPQGRSEKAQDEQALRRVLNVLKPDNVRLRLDMDGQGLYLNRPIRAVYADSEYYEINQSVSPTNIQQSRIYPLSRGQIESGVAVGTTRILPRPPFSAVQTAEWNYANEVVAVRSYAESAETKIVIDGANYDRATDIYGHVIEFSGEKGVLDPRAAEAGRLSTDTSLMNHPYAGDRVKVTTHG